MLTGLSKEELDFLERFSTKVVTENNTEYYYIPYWFKKVGWRSFEIKFLNNVPQELKECINDMRNKVNDIPENLKMCNE